LPGLKTEKTMTTLPPKTISRLFAVTFLPTVSTTPNPAIAIPLQESAINNVVNEPQREPPNTVLQASTHTPQTETNLSEFNSENCQSSVTLMHLDSPDSPSQPSYKRIREFANYDQKKKKREKLNKYPKREKEKEKEKEKEREKLRKRERKGRN
jgi:hypothetical protein